MPLRVQLATAVALVAAQVHLHAQWDLRDTTARPSGRVNAAMVFDPTSGGAILFGGSTALPAPSNQTWRWNGTDWFQLTPATSPSGRYGIELVHDSARGVCVMYGGWTSAIAIGSASSQTWEWNGTTWTQVMPAVDPGGLFNYAMSYDAARSRVVLYGGSTSLAFPSAQHGTWEYNGTTWTPVATTTDPGPLDRAAMAFHVGTGRTVLFGGVDPMVGGNDTTWLFDGAAWTIAPVTGLRPPARTGAAMVYDPFRDVCVLTCGANPTTGQRFDDTWEWDGAAWYQMPTTTTGVLDGCAAFLPSARQVVKFGGQQSFTPVVLNIETWEFGAKATPFGAGCAGTAGTPSLACTAPRLAQPFQVDLTNLSQPANAAILFFGFSTFPAIDLTFLGMPTCALLTEPVVILPISGTGGSASWTWSAVSGAVGDAFYGQALVLDPLATVLGYTISNGVSARIGW